MPEQYVLLSNYVTVHEGFPGHWVADESIPDRVLRQGVTADFTEIANVCDAAEIFAPGVVERKFGEDRSAVSVSPDGRLDGPHCFFEVEVGIPSRRGGYDLTNETVRFAVLVRSEK